MAWRLGRVLAVSLLTALATGCGGTALLDTFTAAPEADKKGDDYYVQRVIELRKELRASPNSTGVTNELRRLEDEAASFYLTAGHNALNQRQYSEAAQKFELGLLASPGNAALTEGRMSALRRREASRLEDQAARAKSVGNVELAHSLYGKAENLEPGNLRIEAALKETEKARTEIDQRFVIKAFQSTTPLDLNFKEAKLKDALRALGDPYELNFVFDSEVEDAEVNVSASRVTLAQAMNMVMQGADTFYKVIGPNSLLIAPNTDDKKAKYADLYYKTFQLRNVKAEQMAQILTSSMELKTVVANKELNTIQIRDSRDTLKIAERLISANDSTPAEIMLDVEILEVNRSKSEQLGIDYGSQVTTSFPQFTLNSLTQPPLAQKVLYDGLVTVPTLTLKYFKNDVDARILARPRVRAIDGNVAKIHIGDRVPLRSATIQDATGQTRTTFEYRDVGIRLEFKPEYHFDDTVTVELKLEVSALGQNLGTTNEPAFSIGTRNVETTMLLREGETAVLGGLIRDEERRRWNKVPGFGDLHVIGRLFSVNDDQDTRTDLLLTITPHVLRAQGLPGYSDSDFYSGRKGNFSTEDAFNYLKKGPKDGPPSRYNLTPDSGKGQIAAAPAGRKTTAATRPAEAKPAIETASFSGDDAGAKLRLAFGTPSYSVENGKTVTVDVLASNLPRTEALSTRVLFNPEKLALVTAQPVANGAGEVRAVKGDRAGAVDVTLANIPPGAVAEETVLARLELRGTAPGLSYLLINATGAPKSRDGREVGVELGSSKVEIR